MDELFLVAVDERKTADDIEPSGRPRSETFDNIAVRLQRSERRL